MTRPDQDERLMSMGVGEAACEECMTKLYPGGDDSVCADCKLNPMQDPESAALVIEQALKREEGFTLPELEKRFAVLNPSKK